MNSTGTPYYLRRVMVGVKRAEFVALLTDYLPMLENLQHKAKGDQKQLIPMEIEHLKDFLRGVERSDDTVIMVPALSLGTILRNVEEADTSQ